MIITLEELKAYLGKNSPTGDAELNPIVDYVNSFIIKFCGLKATNTPTLITRRVTSATGRGIVLPSINVTSVESVKSNGKLVAEEDYYLDEESGIVVFYAEVTTKLFGISIEYIERAFEPSADLKFAALELGKYFHKSEYKNAVSNGQGDSVSFEISKTIPNKIRHILTLNRVL